MKKSYLMMAAAATMFAACTQADFVNEVPEQGPKAIEFKNGYIGKNTRSENSSANYTLNFSKHHESFKVWGYKSTADEPVFSGKPVKVSFNDAGSEIYSYDGLVFWDEAASFYEFYAAAPAEHEWIFNAPKADDKSKSSGYFTTKITLDPERINQGKGAHLESLKPDNLEDGERNNDLLIAASCSPKIGNTVNFEFIHILSRLNIIVSKKPGMTQEVRTFKVSINNMNIYGEFNEDLTEKGITAESLAKGTYDRWSLGAEENVVKSNYVAVSEEGAVLQEGVERYVIQTLIIPQLAGYVQGVKINGEGLNENSAPYLYIEYGVENGKDSAGNKTFERFKKYYNLAEIFGKTTPGLAFNEGWENTLKLTVGPKTIDFNASVATWATSTYKENSLGHQDQNN